MKPKVRDAALSLSLACPVGATTVVTPAGLAIGPVTSLGDYAPSKEGEFIVEIPALTATQLPNATTITVDVIEAANAALTGVVVVHKALLVVTGAGGVGCAAASARFRPATDQMRYVGFQLTGVATVAASGSSAAMTYVS